MVAEVIEEGHDVFVPFQLIMPEIRRGRLKNKRRHSLYFLNQIMMFKELCKKPSACCNILSMDLHLLEAPHAVQDVELLPAFGEVDLPVNEVRVPKVDEGQVLQNETPGRGKHFVKLWLSKPHIKIFLTEIR